MTSQTLTFTNTTSSQTFKFNFNQNPTQTFGRNNLSLNSEKISRTCFKICKELNVNGYQYYIYGKLDVTKPAIMVKYFENLTWTDILVEGMKVEFERVEKLKFVNFLGWRGDLIYF